MSDTIAVTETTGKITCRWAWVNVNLEFSDKQNARLRLPSKKVIFRLFRAPR